MSWAKRVCAEVQVGGEEKITSLPGDNGARLLRNPEHVGGYWMCDPCAHLPRNGCLRFARTSCLEHDARPGRHLWPLGHVLLLGELSMVQWSG